MRHCWAMPAHVRAAAWIWVHCMKSERRAATKKKLGKAKILSQPDRPIQSMLPRLEESKKPAACAERLGRYRWPAGVPQDRNNAPGPQTWTFRV